jgi:hypothetical protein
VRTFQKVSCHLFISIILHLPHHSKGSSCINSFSSCLSEARNKSALRCCYSQWWRSQDLNSGFGADIKPVMLPIKPHASLPNIILICLTLYGALLTRSLWDGGGHCLQVSREETKKCSDLPGSHSYLVANLDCSLYLSICKPSASPFP